MKTLNIGGNMKVIIRFMLLGLAIIFVAGCGDGVWSESEQQKVFNEYIIDIVDERRQELADNIENCEYDKYCIMDAIDDDSNSGKTIASDIIERVNDHDPSNAPDDNTE